MGPEETCPGKQVGLHVIVSPDVPLEIHERTPYGPVCVFHIFHRSPREFHTRLDPDAQFRERRQRHRRRIRRRRISAVLIVAAIAVAITFGFRAVAGSDELVPEAAPPSPTAESALAAEASSLPTTTPTGAPVEVRGVHVTMQLASRPAVFSGLVGLANDGLNTLQIDVKDESGDVAFTSDAAPLASKIAARNYYDPAAIVAQAKEAGLLTIARIVDIEDPVLASNRPKWAIQARGGGTWFDSGGFTWANPYDERAWKYNVDVAESAARAGFDEVMFDYVRFPSDGDLGAMKFPRKVPETKDKTIGRFLQFARNRLAPLGVDMSAAVFGLAASRDLGIGQDPRRLAQYLDAMNPMVYPSLFGSGEFGLAVPEAAPGTVVNRALGHFNVALRGRNIRLVPWLQDFTLPGGSRFGIEEIRAQIAAAERRGTSGYLLWNPHGVYTDGSLLGA